MSIKMRLAGRTRLQINRRLSKLAISLAMFLALAPLASRAAGAQTFTVLYTLNGTTQGNSTGNGLVADRAGNLYGTAANGGIYPCPDDYGCGTVFKLTRHGSSWTFSLLYSFTGADDGWNPEGPLTIGSDGSVYGTTIWGGGTGCGFGFGCGTVFKLSPPPNICSTSSCEWTKTILYRFTGQADGDYPLGYLTLDQAGNLYGTASAAAVTSPYDGSVFELTPSNGGWIFNILYSFPGGTSGAPGGGVVFDSQGNLWGIQAYGGEQDCGDPQLPDPCGSIFKLSPSSSGWTETNVFGFSAATGGGPSGSLLREPSGNFYGTLDTNGPAGGGGIFQFVPSSGEFTMIYSVTGNPEDAPGPFGGVVMDQAGNLYAAAEGAGYTSGFVFELTPENNGWYFTNLHNFTDGSDGATPVGPLVVDTAGNVYGADLKNVVFAITP